MDSCAMKVVKMLWTGGWDSTFRLIQLVLDTRAIIQPIYVIDTGRRSTLVEIRTMDRIKREIAKKFPSADGRILQHRFYLIHDIADDVAITGSYRRLRRDWHLGTQFDWLPRLAKQNDLAGIELCVEADVRPRRGVAACLADHISAVDDEHVGTYWVVEGNGDKSDVSRVFSSFRFPLLGTTKSEMREEMTRRDCIDIMLQTWFCFNPVGDDPCGVCNPCQLAVEEGFSDRLSSGARFRNRILTLKKALRKRVKSVLGVGKSSVDH